MNSNNENVTKAISTERLETALHDANELNSQLVKIYTEYGGWNIRSIENLIGTFNQQVEINGDTYYDTYDGRGLRFADSNSFSWDGDPAKLETLRLGNYKSLAYIYISIKPDSENRLVQSFDIGYELVTMADITEEINNRKPLIPKEILTKAITLFTDLQQLLAVNELSLCYDEDNAAVFIGPKDMAWNVSHIPGEPGSLRDPKLRKFVTNEMINRYAEGGHIASEAICHVHISDPDETFSGCDLTYAV